MLLVVVLIGLAVGIVRVESLRRREVEGRTGVERAVVLTPPVAMSRAQSLAGAGRYDEAIAVLQGAVRTGPYDETLHYALGETMTEHATPEAMIAFFSSEIGQDEKPQTSHYFWAMGLARKGDFPGATAELERALSIDPAHEMSQRLWGVLLERQGRLEAALDHFVEATKIHPEYRDALWDAARVAGKLGRASEQASFEERARTADPNTPRCYLNWARYLHEHGREEAAWAEIVRMLAVRPDDAEALRLRDAVAASLRTRARAP